MNKELVKEELNKEEYNMSLAMRVKRLGGLDNLTEEQAEKLVKRFHLVPKKVSAEETAYMKYKQEIKRYRTLCGYRAEIGEAHIGDAFLYDNAGDDKSLEKLNKSIEECKQNLASLYDIAKKHADWLGVKIDDFWFNN